MVQWSNYHNGDDEDDDDNGDGNEDVIFTASIVHSSIRDTAACSGRYRKGRIVSTHSLFSSQFFHSIALIRS